MVVTNAHGSATSRVASLAVGPPGAPVVTTGTASGISVASATLLGTVNPHGLATTAWFEYGLTVSLGSTANVTLSPDDGSSEQAVSAGISGLQEGTTYHYRLTATNSCGTNPGADATFTTAVPYTYTITNGAVTLTRYTGPGGAAIIPGTINGPPVTSIGDWAFQYCSGLTSITIPASVTTIADGAFGSCTGLTNVTIPNSFTSIGDSVFYGCSSLTNVTIGTDITSIGSYAFYSCTSLASAFFMGNAPSIGANVFHYTARGSRCITQTKTRGSPRQPGRVIRLYIYPPLRRSL